MPPEVADAIVLCRSAVRRICARLGYHATFMSRPQGADGASTGWHLHQSLTDSTPARTPSCRMPRARRCRWSGPSYLAGLLEHAPAATAFTTPTVNGYKRYQPFSLAPDRVAWGIDNKGAMVRAVGGVGDPATRLENRSGEPAANPYLYIASQLISGMDGMERGPRSRPRRRRTRTRRMPRACPRAWPPPSTRSWRMRRSARRWDDTVVDWYATIKRAEFARYLRHVSDWEQREYFGGPVARQLTAPRSRATWPLT